MALPDVTGLSPAERQVVYLAARIAADKQALAAGPAALAAYLDPAAYSRRAHLDIIGETYLRVRTGELRRVTISLPPQTGKSFTAAVWGTFWWLCQHPRHRVVIASYADALALTHGKAVRELVKVFGSRFKLVLRPGDAAMQDWSLTTGGGVRAVGVETALTGHAANLLIVDDPHKDRQEADSGPIRKKVAEWFSSTARSRLSPRAPIIMIGTRWHEDDLIGRYVKKQPGVWHQIRMPALATDADDPLGRQPGEPLPHPRIPPEDTGAALEHWLSAREDSDARDWGSLYMADPKPREGALITDKIMEAARHLDWRQHTEAVKSVVAIDPAGGGRDTTGVIGGHRGADDRVIVTDDRTARMSADEWPAAACELARELDAEEFVVEVNYGGDMATRLLRTAWKTLHEKRPGEFGELCPRIVEVRAKKSKRLRAEPVAQAIKVGKVITGAYLPEFEDEWVGWREGDQSPGRVDASVYLVYRLLRTPARGTQAASPAGVPKSAVALPPRGVRVPTRPATERGRR